MASVPEISVGIVKLTFGMRFRLAQACRRYPVLARMADWIFFQGDDIMVLPRDDTVRRRDIEMNVEVPGPQDTVLPSDVLRTMIRRSQNHVIMHKCICRSSNDCQDFPHDLGCIFMGKGAANIPSSVGRPVSMEEALQHVDLCQEAGLVHIIGRNKIDSVWLNTGPKEELLTVCHCCPCCCLWKMLPELPDHMSGRMTAMPGVKVQVDSQLCVGCGSCVESKCCFVDAISIKEGCVIIDPSRCRACGRCVSVCPHGAITLTIEPDSVRAAVQRVEPLVDVTQG